MNKKAVSIPLEAIKGYSLRELINRDLVDEKTGEKMDNVASITINLDMKTTDKLYPRISKLLQGTCPDPA